MQQLREELSAIWSQPPRYAKVDAALIESERDNGDVILLAEGLTGEAMISR
jgi:hypothetical protein